MTAEIIYLCKREGCRRQRVYQDQPFCDEHRLRWVRTEAPRDTRPAWVRNMAANAKDFTGSVA